MELFKPMDLQADSKKADIEHVEKVRCLILASAPAGYTDSKYVARANHKPVLYTGLQM